MKKVFSSSNECIHTFAQRSQSQGKTPHNTVFFNDDKIYSYGHHYLLGEFLDENTIMINDSGYSATTSKHISRLRGATSQYKQYYFKEIDLSTVHNEVQYLISKLAKANKPEKYILPIFDLWKSLNEFAEYNRKRLKVNKRDYMTYNDSKYKEVKKIVSSLEKGVEDFTKNLAEAQKKRDQKIKADNAKKLKVALIEFNTYQRNSFRIGDEDFLRLSENGERVETSQGVKVSVQSAAQLYQMIQAGIDIKGKRIEGYTVTSINGHLKIGCHNINMESVKSVGEKVLTMAV